MPLTPLAVMGLSLPITAIITVVLLRARPKFSRRKIINGSAMPATLLFLLLLIESGGFRGSPHDWEGLTHVFAPIGAVILIAFQYLVNAAVAAFVFQRLRPSRGYIE